MRVVEEAELEVEEVRLDVVVDVVSVLAESSRRCRYGKGTGLWSNNILLSQKMPGAARLWAFGCPVASTGMHSTDKTVIMKRNI